ncbi:MAG TPA: 3-oxoacyl-[acyl-carrier-protein] reductase [Lentisphaerae bacterium]|nr:MAG: 3-oxoacyl-ACP reductase [Verrucomicrobiota bacterium]HDL77423.1 3-oxoacyl-[acyl-carrier-protein] reductase [Lentisphaerota bacterium]
MADLSGRVALVTGAARGIGQAIAVRLAEDGADVAVCDLKAEWLEETRQKVSSAGRKVRSYEVNVGDAVGVQNVVQQVLGDFGRIDILVNNAGITRDSLLLRLDEKDWDDVLNVNLKGTYLFTRAVARPMMKQRSGAIVNIASIIGEIGNAGQCNYAASKGGVIAFTKSAAKELAARGIRVNAVAPGFIQTRMTEALPEEARQKMLQMIPLARFGQPEDVANVVAFLAGDDASYVTGQVVNVCGGMVT